LIFAILFVSSFIHSTLGFGQAVIAMPLLAMVVELKTATPLVTFVLMTIAAVILLRNWRVVDLNVAWRLVLSSCFGIPVGLFSLKDVPEDLMKVFLGIVVILFSLYNLANRHLKIIDLRRVGGGSMLAYLFGFVAGVLGAAYNTSGVVITIYATLRDWDPDRFRSTLQSYFVFTGLLILASHGLVGLWTPDVLKFYLTSLPLILVGVCLGSRLNRLIPQGQFDGYINVGLLLMGFLLFR
ncbi:sulfite exporter TauE/SafE family protein, partial [Candidatus Poribacteria bacterium]|nr:sulfite exporter TauE/SafE family protein [Candidatus Poribacteria bacterium]